jgi:hypothetical protein
MRYSSLHSLTQGLEGFVAFKGEAIPVSRFVPFFPFFPSNTRARRINPQNKSGSIRFRTVERERMMGCLGCRRFLSLGYQL